MPKIFQHSMLEFLKEFCVQLHFAGFLQKAEKSENTENLFINLHKKNRLRDLSLNKPLDFALTSRIHMYGFKYHTLQIEVLWEDDNEKSGWYHRSKLITISA